MGGILTSDSEHINGVSSDLACLQFYHHFLESHLAHMMFKQLQKMNSAKNVQLQTLLALISSDSLYLVCQKCRQLTSLLMSEDKDKITLICQFSESIGSSLHVYKFFFHLSSFQNSIELFVDLG